jgi:hypothetical protein
MNSYSLIELLNWIGVGFLSGEMAAQIIIDLINGNLNPNQTSTTVLAYLIIGLFAGYIKEYGNESIVELIIKY